MTNVNSRVVHFISGDRQGVIFDGRYNIEPSQFQAERQPSAVILGSRKGQASDSTLHTRTTSQRLFARLSLTGFLAGPEGLNYDFALGADPAGSYGTRQPARQFAPTSSTAPQNNCCNAAKHLLYPSIRSP